MPIHFFDLTSSLETEEDDVSTISPKLIRQAIQERLDSIHDDDLVEVTFHETTDE